MSLFQVTKKQVIENYELRAMTGDIVSFTPSYSQLLPDPFSDLNVTVNVVATGGYDADTQTAHPINGYSSANITRCGVNIWDEDWEVGGLNTITGGNWNTSDRIRSKNYISIKPSTSIYIKYPTSCVSVNYCFYDANKTFISSYSTVNQAITTPANACFLKFATYAQYGTTYNNDISINYPSTDTTYHAYNGQTYTIAFGQTVYGGVPDVTTGKLTVDSAIVDFGDLSITYQSSYHRFKCSMPSNYRLPVTVSDRLDIICSCYVPDMGAISGTVNYAIAGYYGDNNIYVSNSDYTDAGLFKTAMTGQKIVYKLENPFDIDLTPVQIRALVGENNVYADCGETTVTCLI